MIESPLGQELFENLPEVYRTRDNPERVEGVVIREGDLALYLDACGHLLDLIAATLNQRLKDTTPDECQPWLLPYFASLVGGRLRSTDEEGRRGEVANAIAWRQAKGTLACVDAMAQTVASTAAEVQEGWKRVVLTARIGEPVLSAVAYGCSADIPLRMPDADVDMLAAATHPGLPMGTVDFRRPSRAVQTARANPAARPLNVAGTAVWWRTANAHGNPCSPGGFDDHSARTVDLRSPAWSTGHYHPKRLLLFLPPPRGMYFAGQQTLAWTDLHAPHSRALIRILADPATVRYQGLTDGPLRITGAVALDDGKTHIFENLAFTGPVTLASGAVAARNSGFVQLSASAADTDAPVADLSDVLLGSLLVPNGLARLSGCTVLADLTARRLQATDCILPDSLVLSGAGALKPSCLRFSRIPDLPPSTPPLVEVHRCTLAPPVYLETASCAGGVMLPGLPGVPLPNLGILHAAVSGDIATGAEDGGEMGAYHAANHRGRIAAVLAKLEEFLPVGMEAAVIVDWRMTLVPPELKER